MCKDIGVCVEGGEGREEEGWGEGEVGGQGVVSYMYVHWH